MPETAEAEIPEAAEEAAPAEEPPAAPEEDGKSEKADKKTEKSRKKEKNEAMALKAENERLAKELAEAKDSYQRMLAEYANYKRRTEQEKERLGEFTKAELLGKLLTSLDNGAGHRGPGRRRLQNRRGHGAAAVPGVAYGNGP